MSGDTDLGGPQHAFPPTAHSAIRAACDADVEIRRAGLDTLVAGYWKPVYKHIRRHWNAANEEAKDLTQGFFAELLERELLQRFDPSRASFRTYLRVCADGYVANARRAAGRLKRGGGLVLSLDFDAAEAELADTRPGGDAAEFFSREWTRSLFVLAIADLRAQCAAENKQTWLQLFERYDLCATPESRPTYAELAREFNLPVTQVTNGLNWARHQLRGRLCHHLRRLTATDAEFRDEARRLLGEEQV